MSAKRVVVGTISRTHGLRGEMAIKVDSDNPARFQPPARFQTNHDRFPLLVLQNARPGPKGLIVEFAGIISVELASDLVGADLMIDASERQPLGDGEFWPDELIGLEVRGDGVVFGIVSDVVLGAQTRLEVQEADGTIVDLPFVSALVPEVDIAGGWIRADPPEGLFSDA